MFSSWELFGCSEISFRRESFWGHFLCKVLLPVVIRTNFVFLLSEVLELCRSCGSSMRIVLSPYRWLELQEFLTEKYLFFTCMWVFTIEKTRISFEGAHMCCSCVDKYVDCWCVVKKTSLTNPLWTVLGSQQMVIPSYASSSVKSQSHEISTRARGWSLDWNPSVAAGFALLAVVKEERRWRGGALGFPWRSCSSAPVWPSRSVEADDCF